MGSLNRGMPRACGQRRLRRLYQALTVPTVAARATIETMRFCTGDLLRLGTNGKRKVIPLSGEKSRKHADYSAFRVRQVAGPEARPREAAVRLDWLLSGLRRRHLYGAPSSRLCVSAPRSRSGPRATRRWRGAREHRAHPDG